MQPPLCGGRPSPCAGDPPRGVPIPPRPRQDRRDSDVTAAVWGKDLTVCPQFPTGRSYPSAAQAGPEGADVTAAVWEKDLTVCPQSPRGRSYPSVGQAGPEGLGCNRRCVGVVSLCARDPRQGTPIPLWPRQDRRDSVVAATVWGKDLNVCLQSPTGRSNHFAAQAGPEGLGCNRRCVGEGPLCVPTIPTGRPYPSAAGAGPEGLGRNRHFVGEGAVRAPRIPHRASLSLRGPGRIGGTRV